MGIQIGLTWPAVIVILIIIIIIIGLFSRWPLRQYLFVIAILLALYGLLLLILSMFIGGTFTWSIPILSAIGLVILGLIFCLAGGSQRLLFGLAFICFVIAVIILATTTFGTAFDTTQWYKTYAQVSIGIAALLSLILAFLG